MPSYNEYGDPMPEDRSVGMKVASGIACLVLGAVMVYGIGWLWTFGVLAALGICGWLLTRGTP